MTVNLAWRNAIAATNSAWLFDFDPAAETGFVEYLPLELIARFQLDYRPPQRLAPDRFTKYAEYDPLPGRMLNAFTSHMQAACKSGALPHVRATDPANPNRTIQQVSARDFAAWLALQGEEPSTHIRAWFKAAGMASPAPATSAPAPAAPADSASNAPVVTPPPVATGDVAYAFDGLRGWNEKAWKDTLGSPPKWLGACIAIRGQRGVRENHWNPVLIGAALVHNGHAKQNSIRARFQTKTQLKDWLEAWKTYEADNFDTQ